MSQISKESHDNIIERHKKVISFITQQRDGLVEALLKEEAKTERLAQRCDELLNALQKIRGFLFIDNPDSISYDIANEVVMKIQSDNGTQKT